MITLAKLQALDKYKRHYEILVKNSDKHKSNYAHTAQAWIIEVFIHDHENDMQQKAILHTQQSKLRVFKSLDTVYNFLNESCLHAKKITIVDKSKQIDIQLSS